MNRPRRKPHTLQQLLMFRGTALLMGILILLGALLIPERLRSYDAALDDRIALVANAPARKLISSDQLPAAFPLWPEIRKTCAERSSKVVSNSHRPTSMR